MESLDNILAEVAALQIKLENLKSQELAQSNADSLENRLQKYGKVYNGTLNPLKGHIMLNTSTFIKDTYLKFLAAVCLCDEQGLQESQYNLLARIASGIGITEKVDDFIRDAMAITEADYGRFCEEIGRQKYKYSWCLDTLILLGLHNSVKGTMFLADITCVFALKKEEIKALVKLARVILEQDGEAYSSGLEERASSLPDDLGCCYARGFVCGLLKNNRQECHYFSPDVDPTRKIILERVYKCNTLIFENVVVDIDRTIEFNCQKLVFKNCYIIGDKYNLGCEVVRTVLLENSKFVCFENGLFLFEQLEYLTVNKCAFENCRNKTGYMGCRMGCEMAGILFFFKNIKLINLIIISNSTFYNCYADTYNEGIILASNQPYDFKFNFIYLLNNTFRNCRSANGNWGRARDKYILFDINHDDKIAEKFNNNIIDNETRLIKFL